MMSAYKHKSTAIIAAVLCLLAFAACSDDSQPKKDHRTYPLHPLLGSVHRMSLSTRAAFNVTGDETNKLMYEGFDEAYPTPINPTYKTIGIFLAQEQADNADNYRATYTTPIGEFKWRNNFDWATSVPVEAGEKYYLYGFMPNNGDGATQEITLLDGETTWAAGAKMTYKNLPTVTGADVCAIVGVKPGDPTKSKGDQFPITSASLNWTKVNQFDSEMPAVPTLGNHYYVGKVGDGNCIYLLLNHLYANINLEMMVDEEYSKLRTIVIKQVKMKSHVKSRIDLQVLVRNSATNPLTIIFPFTESAGAEEEVEAEIFPIPPTNTELPVEHEGNLDDNGRQKYSSVPGYFAPMSNDQQFTFTFTYDVYDKKGHKVRENCTAVNKWTRTAELLAANNITTLTSGMSFRVKVEINPTYLYQLSEPDLDNPTITLE